MDIVVCLLRDAEFFWRKQYQFLDIPCLVASACSSAQFTDPFTLSDQLLSLFHKQLIQPSLSFLSIPFLPNPPYHCRGLQHLDMYSFPKYIHLCLIYPTFVVSKSIRNTFYLNLLVLFLHVSLASIQFCFCPSQVSFLKSCYIHCFCFFTFPFFLQSTSSCLVKFIIPLKLFIPRLPTVSVEINST